MMNTDKPLKRYFWSHYKSISFAFFLSVFSAHGYSLSNLAGNNDTMGIVSGTAGAGTTSGRWFLDILTIVCKCLFGDVYFIPWFNLWSGFFLIACSAFLLCYLFQVQSGVITAAVTSVMIVFPSVTAMALYGYTFHFNMFGLLLAVCSAVLCLRATPLSCLSAALLTALSLGIYQAYMPFACAVLTLYWIRRLADGDPCRSVLRSVLLSGITVLAGLTLYLLMTKVFCMVFHVSLSGYKGINRMASALSPDKIFFSLAYSYGILVALLCRKTWGLSPTLIFNIAYIIYDILSFAVVILLYKKIRNDRRRAVLFFLLLIFFPVASHLIILMTGGNKDVLYAPVFYGTAAIFLFLPLFCENAATVNRKKIINCVMGTLILLWIWNANGVYTASHMAIEQNIAVWNRIIAKTEALDGYTREMPVCIVGANPEFPSVINSWQDFNQIATLTHVSGWALPNFLKNYLGWEKTFLSVSDLPSFPRAAEHMPVWPEEGSIEIINGIVVLRFE